MPKPARTTDVVQTDAQATAAITAAGYTNPTNLAHHGRVWRADATDSTGAAVVVVVHGKDGRVNVDDTADTAD